MLFLPHGTSEGGMVCSGLSVVAVDVFEGHRRERREIRSEEPRELEPYLVWIWFEALSCGGAALWGGRAGEPSLSNSPRSLKNLSLNE